MKQSPLYRRAQSNKAEADIERLASIWNGVDKLLMSIEGCINAAEFDCTRDALRDVLDDLKSFKHDTLNPLYATVEDLQDKIHE